MRAIFNTVNLINGAVIAAIKLTDLKDVAAIALTVLCFAYTAWKWNKESKERK